MDGFDRLDVSGDRCSCGGCAGQKGLGNIVSSWVSTGPNLPVSDGQIQSALGSDAISALAQKAGVAPGMASSMLAQILPRIVDKLTPEGKIPESGNLLQKGLDILKGFNS